MLWNNFTKVVILRCAGLLMCVLPVTVAILSYFPIWLNEGGEKVLSGVTVLLLTVALVPMYKGIRRLFKSPASYTLWFVAFILFLLLSQIAEEMTVISFIGFLGNGIGAILFKLSERMKRKGGD